VFPLVHASDRKIAELESSRDFFNKPGIGRVCHLSALVAEFDRREFAERGGVGKRLRAAAVRGR
jgi:hypothetical protein